MSGAAGAQTIVMQRFRSPKTAIGQFVAKRVLRGAVLWGLVFGVYVASKAIGFVGAYPTEAGRQKAAELLSSNVGIEVILGSAPRSTTTAAYVAWNTLSAMVIIGGIWAFLLATKFFRGEEDSGRWEVMLAGQTTARRAAANVLAGLGVGLVAFYVVIAAAFIAVGRARGIDFGPGPALLLALATVSGVGLFMAVGALASQLMPTRGRAASVSAAVFGIFFVLRAAGDITSAHWLLNITPLGWIEKLQPLSNGQPLWFLPIAGLVLVLCLLAVFLAGKRDLGEGILADKATAKPRTALLNSPLAAATRLTRSANLGWLIAISAGATLFGLLTKSAAQVFSQSASAEHVLSRLDRQSQVAGTTAFLGIVFFLQMALIMAYAASSVAAIRRDEAEGYLDNFLVRPVSRARWLWGRICLVTMGVILAGLLASLGTWIGIASQHTAVSFHTLLLAGINALVPAALTIGFGIFAFGFRPRLTSLAAYGVLAWSFLIEMVSSGINLNHWILDTSVLHQIALAPAASPRWGVNAVLIVIGVILCLAGVLRFNTRDLEGE